MKNCTNHFMKRWVERIVGIEDTSEVKEYIVKNKDRIIESANKTFEYTQFLWRGQIGDNITRNYYIEDDIVFVTNTTDDAFITVYKVDLGFTPELNATVRKGLIEEIKKLTEEKERVELEISEEIEDKEHAAETLQEQIAVLEQEIENLKKQRDFTKEEVKNLKRKSLNVGLELKRFTMMLVNSKEYKEDLRSTHKS